LREAFRVQWDNGEPVEIMTTAADLIAAIDLIGPDESTNKVALSTRLIHVALQRKGYEPPPYAEWLDVLDRYDPVKVVAGVPGPTRLDPSAIGPSSSPSSPAPTGGRGSKKTTGRSTPRKKSSSTSVG
jgi:hypothetical protein